MALLYEVACDYLTMTWSGIDTVTPMDNRKEWVEWVQGVERKWGGMSRLKRWAWQGYIGWSLGTVSWGERADGYLLRLSGIMADEYFMSSLPTGHNCSRFDISVTIFGIQDIDGFIADHKEEAIQYRKTLQHRPFSMRYIDSVGDGNTLYLGARTSERYLRIYNKQKEQANDERWQGAIRYECEYKEGSARQVLERGRSSDDRRATLARFMVGACKDRGINIPVVLVGSGPLAPAHQRLRNDDETSLEWLRTQVSPTIRRLLDNGRYDDIITALGLERRKDDRDDG